VSVLSIEWYDEMTFISEVIANLYSYMANQNKDTLELAFQKLGKRYRFRYDPISSSSASGELLVGPRAISAAA
jgi:hypothetical protein